MEQPEGTPREGLPKPLVVGRALRVLCGVALLAGLAAYRPGGPVVLSILLFLGISLVVGGLLAHPGCEILALPSLVARKQLQCF